MAEEPVNILLVDDEPRNLDVLEAVLQSSDCRLVRATSGEEALMALIREDFAAIVLDVHMPGMSGLEVAKLVKQRKRNQHIPILFLTAYYQEERDILRGYVAGAVDYLTKPIDAQILRSKVTVFVQLSRMTRALARVNDALFAEVLERQRAQEELRGSNDRLEARVQARTAELTQVNAELRRREETLDESRNAERRRREELEALMEAAPAAIWMTRDRECRCVTGNRAAYQMLRMPADADMMPWSGGAGPSHVEVYRGGARVEWSDLPMQVAARTGQPVLNQEFEFRFQDGTSTWAYGNASPLVDESGAVRGAVAVFTDISEQKQTEEALRAAKSEAEAASRAKDDFLAVLSHELRTPLNPALMIASEHERNPKLDPEIRAAFAAIREGIELEVGLIDDLLDLTRIAQRRIRLNVQPLDLHDLLRRTWDLVRMEAQSKNLQVVFLLNATNPWVQGDLVRLQQVFWNLFRNAARFTPAGGRVVQHG
jgi:CheY-like chemotaxis protein